MWYVERGQEVRITLDWGGAVARGGVYVKSTKKSNKKKIKDTPSKMKYVPEERGKYLNKKEENFTLLISKLVELKDIFLHNKAEINSPLPLAGELKNFVLNNKTV